MVLKSFDYRYFIYVQISPNFYLLMDPRPINALESMLLLNKFKNIQKILRNPIRPTKPNEPSLTYLSIESSPADFHHVMATRKLHKLAALQAY